MVFSGVDQIIRGKLEDLNLDDACNPYGVKFWGAVVVGKDMDGLQQRTQANGEQRRYNTTSSAVGAH